MDPELFRSVDPGPDSIKDPREPRSKILPVRINQRHVLLDPIIQTYKFKF